MRLGLKSVGRQDANASTARGTAINVCVARAHGHAACRNKAKDISANDGIGETGIGMLARDGLLREIYELEVRLHALRTILSRLGEAAAPPAPPSEVAPRHPDAEWLRAYA